MFGYGKYIEGKLYLKTKQGELILLKEAINIYEKGIKNVMIG